MNILLIEDSKGDIFLMDSALKDLGIAFELSIKESGKEALEYIVDSEAEHAMAPDFIILDLNLPIFSGFEVLECIKLSTLLKDTPAIIFSSSAAEEDKKRALGLGAAAYFTKPLDYDDYISTVESFLSTLNL